jgi:hypothetical protein
MHAGGTQLARTYMHSGCTPPRARAHACWWHPAGAHIHAFWLHPRHAHAHMHAGGTQLARTYMHSGFPTIPLRFHMIPAFFPGNPFTGNWFTEGTRSGSHRSTGDIAPVPPRSTGAHINPQPVPSPFPLLHIPFQPVPGSGSSRSSCPCPVPRRARSRSRILELAPRN